MTFSIVFLGDNKLLHKFDSCPFSNSCSPSSWRKSNSPWCILVFVLIFPRLHLWSLHLQKANRSLLLRIDSICLVGSCSRLNKHRSLRLHKSYPWALALVLLVISELLFVVCGDQNFIKYYILCVVSSVHLYNLIITLDLYCNTPCITVYNQAFC